MFWRRKTTPTLGRNIQGARLAAQLRSDEMSYMCKISVRELIAYERGRPPSLEMLGRLARVVGVPPAALLSGVYSAELINERPPAPKTPEPPWPEPDDRGADTEPEPSADAPGLLATLIPLGERRRP